jgi:diaminopimelate decarboxylase
LKKSQGKYMQHSLLIAEPLETKIRELVRSQGSPFYLYDTAGIRQTCRKFTDIPYEPKSVHFALMANAAPQFIRIIKDTGLKVFVNSLLHLETALQLGFQGEEIVYAASAMDVPTMTKAQSCGALVVLDSPSQYEVWRRLFPNSGASIRCNIGELVQSKETLAGYFIGRESRLGFTIEEIKALQSDPNIIGLHSYIGTNILDIDYFFACYNRIAELAELFPALRFLDFGGGFGLAEEPSGELDMQAYGLKVSALMGNISRRVGRQIKLLLEPGRIIGGEDGYFVCEVIDIKQRSGKQLIGVNASCVQFPRPLFYPDSAYHPVALLQRDAAPEKEESLLSSVFGCSTYSRDFLSRDVLLPRAEVGDLVVLGYAGSYCASSYTKFLGFAEAQEHYI